MVLIFVILLIALCCLIMWRAGDGYETASIYLGRNLSEGVRGATINAIGSSLPELFTTLFFLFILHDKDGFSGGIGTTAGSAIFNGMIIPALVILVVVLKGIKSSVAVSRRVLLRDGIALLGCELALIFLIGGNTLTWVHGLTLMGLYAAYVIYMLRAMKKHQKAEGFIQQTDDVPESEEAIVAGNSDSLLKNLLTLNLEPIFIKGEIRSGNAWALLAAATAVIAAACLLLVKSCEWLGETLNVPVYFVAVVLASAATSVPDTILSMKDAQKGNYDDAVSNALGSNIFDVCFALGFPLFLFTVLYGPITLSPETLIHITELRILLFILTIFAFLIYIARRKMGAMSAFLLVLIYVVFTLYILGRAIDSDSANEISRFLARINEWINGLRFF
ncbi:MAG: sodium:calcium antiporter [Saprospiraceae bacterium]|nr:sodium:calcium antiporter [Saprospiraceae bacterium]